MSDNRTSNAEARRLQEDNFIERRARRIVQLQVSRDSENAATTN
jgi:hypothetical protein